MTADCASTGCPEYRELSRRRFMGYSGATAAVALAPAWLPRVALARSHRGATRDVIVSIYLRGASDGLTVCVPHGDNAYYTARPALNIPRPDSGLPNRATNLDGFFGLPPAMNPLLPAYQDGRLLFVHACGSTDTSRSHFDAQRLMEKGNIDDPTVGTGWLGRHLHSVDPLDPNAILRAVGIATGLQLTLVGAPDTLPIPDLDNFGITGNAATIAARSAALNDMYGLVADPVRAAAQTSLQTIDLLNTINFAGYAPAGGAVYPTSGFGLAMKSAAALIKAQIGVEAIAIDLSGWDTHNNQGVQIGGVMGNLMADLANTLAAFDRDMTALPAPSYTAVCMSEFGRRLAENGSAGTDHGHGNCMLVLGNCVAGGRVLSQWPGLDPGQLFQGRDLAITIDYRDVLAEIVQQRLGNPNIAAVFPGFAPTPRGVFAC